MKKLLTICLIMATAFTVNAQDGKPTKEETLFWLSKYANDLLPDLKAYGKDYYQNCRLEFNENNMKVYREVYNTDGLFSSENIYIIEYKYIHLQAPDKINFKISDDWGRSDSNDIGYFTLSTVKNQVDINGSKTSYFYLPYVAIKDTKGSKTDVLRVIKAIMNMAKLSGAPNIPQVTKSTF